MDVRGSTIGTIHDEQWTVLQPLPITVKEFVTTFPCVGPLGVYLKQLKKASLSL